MCSLGTDGLSLLYYIQLMRVQNSVKLFCSGELHRQVQPSGLHLGQGPERVHQPVPHRHAGQPGGRGVTPACRYVENPPDKLQIVELRNLRNIHFCSLVCLSNRIYERSLLLSELDSLK